MSRSRVLACSLLVLACIAMLDIGGEHAAEFQDEESPTYTMQQYYDVVREMAIEMKKQHAPSCPHVEMSPSQCNLNHWEERALRMSMEAFDSKMEALEKQAQLIWHNLGLRQEAAGLDLHKLATNGISRTMFGLVSSTILVKEPHAPWHTLIGLIAWGSSGTAHGFQMESEQETLHDLDAEPDEVGEGQGRRGGAFLSTAGSFTLSSGNRAGNSERQKLMDLGAAPQTGQGMVQRLQSLLFPSSQDKGSEVTAGNCRATFVRAPYEKELTVVAEGTPRLGSSHGGTRRRRNSAGTRRRRRNKVPPVVFKPGTPFAVNAIQAPGCGLRFNPCRTTGIKTAQTVGSGYLVQVDRHGCTACPVNFFPQRHYLGGSGKVLCTKPKSGPLFLSCYPSKARQMVSKQKGGPLPPISCFVLGYRSSNILNLGRKETVFVGIKAICLFSKHVQCLTDTHNKRSCAVSKRVYFRAVDTCMKRVPYCKKRTKLDQCQEFDYTQCTGKTYSTKEQLAQHKDDYCVRTCEDNMPSTYGLTKGYKGGKKVRMFPADSAYRAHTSDNAIPLTVAEGTEGAEQLLFSIGGSDHGPALKADLGLLLEGPGLCATVGANM